MTAIANALFRVIDTETTGFEPEKGAAICELGVCDVEKPDGIWMQWAHLSWLCNPGHPIPPECKAVHHITDAMVQGLPPVQGFFPMIEPPRPEAAVSVVYVAHNAAFDRTMLEAAGFPKDMRWLCTWRLALHVYPDAPSYKNEALRYWLGHDTLPWSSGTSHRADHDAAVTALVLRAMLEQVEARGLASTVDELIALAESPVLLRGKLGFGKHGDLTWEEVGRQHPDYLAWMLREEKKKPGSWEKDKLHTARHYVGPAV